MELLDYYLPDYLFSEIHSRVIAATSERVIDAAEAYRPESDPFFRRMILLRELPMRLLGRQQGRAPFGLQDFTRLHRQKSQLVYGLAGRFWQSDYGLVTITDGTAFRDFNQPGIARLALGFSAVALDNGTCRLTTETRVHCPDRASTVRFAPYWYAIRPVSGLIRQRILVGIKNMAEQYIS